MTMDNILKRINSKFWDEDIWLPPNFTWKDMSDTSKTNYAQFSDLYYPFLIALALLVIRFVLERFVFAPIGGYFGIKPKIVNVPTNAVLEKAYSLHGSSLYKQVKGLAKQIDWSERSVERWIRKRVLKDKPSTLNKFTESAWRFTFYAFVFCFGVSVLYDKPWFLNTTECFVDYPHHDISNGVWWHYMIELGFYWSLTFSQFMDVRRKDFFQMFIHHIVTILLLIFSWTTNLFRIGSLVLVIHDFADVPLEAAKMTRYLQMNRFANLVFAVFTIAWIFSRLMLYPYRILYNTSVVAIRIVPMYPAYYIFNGLLCALQLLHILWTYFIVKVAIATITSKSPGVIDVRSDTEDNDSYGSSTTNNDEATDNDISSGNEIDEAEANDVSENNKVHKFMANNIAVEENTKLKQRHS